MGATKRDVVFTLPFMLFALATIGYGFIGLAVTPPTSWTLVVAVIVGVIICGPLNLPVGRQSGYPVVGVSIAMLVIQPMAASPQLGVCIWAMGFLISQLVKHQDALRALHVTGLSSAAAFVAVTVQAALVDIGVWAVLSFLAAITVYYVLTLAAAALLRPWGRPSFALGISLRVLSFPRVGIAILVVTAVVSLMHALNSLLIPWLERDPSVNASPFVVLLTALLFYAVAQRKRYAGVERQLRAVVDAAVELPRETPEGLAGALQSRVRSTVQVNEVELRSTEPGPHEIGSPVRLEEGVDQYVVASRKFGGVPFDREDERTLATLAYMASEAARIQSEVDLLERRANSDPLTGLPNYRSFQTALADANENRSYHEGIAVLFLDLDNFKVLNDSHGHVAGDEMLRVVAERLRSAAGGGDFVSRVGGDEFVVILRGLVSVEEAQASAHRIVQAVNQPIPGEEHPTRAVVSAGLAFSSHRELDPQTLVEDADRAMLRNKRSRSAVSTEGGSTVALSSHHSTRTNDLVARAIHDNRLGLAFQPIVNIETGRIWAFEALVRYVDPEIGPISPPSLVARAKSLGLLNELTKQVVTKSLYAAEQIRKVETSIITMTVNFEVGQISDDELGPFIREAARAHPHLQLCVELNEHSLRSATDDLRNDARVLQEDGVIIALDDYGSDESSVGALVNFPIDLLKIDKSLISNLQDVRQREIIKALQGFGDSVGHTMVVEGIETQTMLDTLLDLGVHNAQGYFFGRPIALTPTLDRLRSFGAQARLD